MRGIVVLGLWLQNEGNLRAYALVRVFKTTVDDYRVVQQDGQKPFVQPPQKVRVVDGRETFRGPVVGFPNDIKVAVETAVLDAYHAQLGKRDGDAVGYKGHAYSTGDIPGYHEPKGDAQTGVQTDVGLTQGIDGETDRATDGGGVSRDLAEQPKGATGGPRASIKAVQPAMEI